MPMEPGTPCGESEYSHGSGMYPNPKRDYDRGKSGFPTSFEGHPNRHDHARDMIAYRRLDSAQKGETLEDMYTAAGNTDRFGPGLPLVQQDASMTPKKPVEEIDWSMKREY